MNLTFLPLNEPIFTLFSPVSGCITPRHGVRQNNKYESRRIDRVEQFSEGKPFCTWFQTNGQKSSLHASAPVNSKQNQVVWYFN